MQTHCKTNKRARDLETEETGRKSPEGDGSTVTENRRPAGTGQGRHCQEDLKFAEKHATAAAALVPAAGRHAAENSSVKGQPSRGAACVLRQAPSHGTELRAARRENAAPHEPEISG